MKLLFEFCVKFCILIYNGLSWSAMVSSYVSLKFASYLATCLEFLSSKFTGRSLIVLKIAVEKSGCVIYGEGKVGTLVDTVETVRMEHVFVDEDTARNKYLVWLVKCSEGQRIVEFFIHI